MLTTFKNVNPRGSTHLSCVCTGCRAVCADNTCYAGEWAVELKSGYLPASQSRRESVQRTHLHANTHVCAKSPQLCYTLCNPVDCNAPGSLVHGILQARILEWVAFSSSRGSSQPRDRTHVSCIGGQILYP